MRWTHTAPPRTAIDGLTAALGVSRPAACLLHRLGVDPTAGDRFLRPQLRGLGDPFHLTNMAAAVARVRETLAAGGEILVFGDYDVDGVTSTAFLLGILHRMGVYPRYAVPRRLEEGYGLSMAALARVLEAGPKPALVICVDCGTNSADEVAWLMGQGIGVVVLDHHQGKDSLPPGAVLVNPHVFDPPDAPWRELCTVGLVFKFVHALLKQLRAEGDDLALQIDIREFLDLVALGTVADLVPLVGENRLLTKKGLESLSGTRRAGLSALFQVSGMTLGAPVTPFDIAFRLSPRINASGRLGDASAPIEMLLSEDWTRCREAAQQLDEFNKERQAIERTIAEQAEAIVDAEFADAPALVLAHADWHPGVVGIVASRIAAKYHRPALVLGAEGTQLKGSGRTIAGISLLDALTPCAALLESWGGHHMAVGVALQDGRIGELRAAFCEAVLACRNGGQPEPELDIACWLGPDELSEALLDELDLLGPFGQGNPEPVFGISSVALTQRPVTFGSGHCRFQVPLARGRRMQCIAWRQADRPPPVGEPLDLAVRLSWNYWNDKKNPQLQLEAWRPANIRVRM